MIREITPSEQRLNEIIHEYAAENAALKQQNERLKYWECECCGFRMSAEHDNGDGSGYTCPECETSEQRKVIQQLKADNAVLMECLQWYADKENHKNVNEDGHWLSSLYEMDEGKAARECLYKIGGSQPGCEKLTGD